MIGTMSTPRIAPFGINGRTMYTYPQGTTQLWFALVRSVAVYKSSPCMQWLSTPSSTPKTQEDPLAIHMIVRSRLFSMDPPDHTGTPTLRQPLGKLPAMEEASLVDLQPTDLRQSAGMSPNSLGTWHPPDVVADEFEAVADRREMLGLSRHQVKVLRQVAVIVRAHDEYGEVEAS